jgi:DNA repair protein RecO (recombination protein O)
VGGTLHQTKAVILRVVPYGDSSLIVTAYTELFGLQSYLAQGIRKVSKNKGASTCFMPGALLDLVVYYNEFKQLNRIKEFKWAFLYRHLFSDIIKNSILLYMVELAQKTIRQPEVHSELFHFLEDTLMQLDLAEADILPNFPLFFSVHLSYFFGFQPHEKSDFGRYLDLQEGIFTDSKPSHVHYTEEAATEAIRELLKVRLPSELSELQWSNTTRRELLLILEQFYMLHIHDFGKMKSTSILQEVLSA